MGEIRHGISTLCETNTVSVPSGKYGTGILDWVGLGVLSFLGWALWFSVDLLATTYVDGNSRSSRKGGN